MEVFEAVRTVLAVRDYQDKPVPSDVVERIVEAGRLTASSMNAQPWHFITVENRETLCQLGALAILAFGYPARALDKGKKQRKPLSEVAHRERFGRPFA